MSKKKLQQNIDSVFDKMEEAFRECDFQKKKVLASLQARREAFPAGDIEDAVNLGKLENDNFKLLKDINDVRIKLITQMVKLVSPTIEMKDPREKLNDKPDAPILNTDLMDELRMMAEQEAKKEIKYNLEDL